MARIDIDRLLKIAEDFEEAIPPSPPTLPAGLEPFKDKPTPKIEETPPTARFLFQKEMNPRMVKDLMLKFNHIFSLSRGAVSVLSSMNKGIILHPTMGLDAYLTPISEELEKIYSIVGKKTD